MTKQRILSTGLGLAATLSMVACGPAPTATPSPSPSASASASVAPSAEPTVAPSASVAPSAEPTAMPTAAPTAMPTAVPTTDPNASPTATPLPSATSDISIIETTTFNGKVFDDTQSPLDGVTVKARSLNASVPFNVETVTAGGTYAFNNAPSGVQVEIIASKPGFTTRKRVEVLKSNKQGDPNANRYDFGNDGSVTGFSAAYNALSDKPEVIMVTPARNGSGVDPKTSFVLKFSEPMDKKTAEDTFTVRSFNSRKLTVDAGNTTRTNTVTGNGAVATNFLAGNSTQIWDKDAFNISWNSDDTEITFSFKEEKLLPTDKDSNLVPDYNVAFRSFSGGDRVLKDKSGISRNEKHFKLTDGDFEESYKFAIKTDEAKPTVTGITAETNENGGNNGDAVKVRYSERMIIYTRDISIAGGMENTAGSDTKAAAAYPGGTIATSSATAKNYNTTIVQTGGTTTYSGTWNALGGTAVYDTTDLTHKTVLLLPPTLTTAVTGGYLNTQMATTAAAAGVMNFTDAADVYTVDVNFIKADGSAVAGTAAADVATGVHTAAALATLLQTDLNNQAAGAAGCSANPFTVTLSADSKSFNIVFSDTSGTYIGWVKNAETITDNVGTNDNEPGAIPAGTFTVAANAKLSIYKPGDTVRIKVNSTVLDPAGNTLDSSRDNASANAS